MNRCEVTAQLQIWNEAATSGPQRDAMTRAHLLIQADPGTGEALRQHLIAIPGVCEAAETSGPFDAVAQVAVDDEDELQRVLRATRSAPGLARICLCRGTS